MWAGRAVGVLPELVLTSVVASEGGSKKAEASRLRKWGCERAHGAWGSM